MDPYDTDYYKGYETAWQDYKEGILRLSDTINDDFTYDDFIKLIDEMISL
jgi:hypothetical protein